MRANLKRARVNSIPVPDPRVLGFSTETLADPVLFRRRHRSQATHDLLIKRGPERNSAIVRTEHVRKRLETHHLPFLPLLVPPRPCWAWSSFFRSASRRTASNLRIVAARETSEAPPFPCTLFLSRASASRRLSASNASWALPRAVSISTLTRSRSSCRALMSHRTRMVPGNRSQRSISGMQDGLSDLSDIFEKSCKASMSFLLQLSKGASLTHHAGEGCSSPLGAERPPPLLNNTSFS